MSALRVLGYSAATTAIAFALFAGCSSTDPPAPGGESEAGSDGPTTTTTPDGGVVAPDGSPKPPRDGGTTGDGAPDEDGAAPDPDAGGLDCTGAAGNPAGAATVSGYMDTLVSQPSAATRPQAIDAILRTCEAFGPAVWPREQCWAFLAAAISKESGYNPTVTVRDGYATRNVGGKQANDPVVGLLQVRFSSTVHEVSVLASKARLTCAGCTLPASFAAHAAESGNSDFWAVNGPTQHMSVMTNVACNVAMGAWFYFVNASGNGKAAAVTYPNQYCSGLGTGGNIITGLLSHLKGSEGGRGFIANQSALNGLQTTDPGGYGYVTQIKSWFDTMLGPVTPHPFFLRMPPDPAVYCE